MSDSPCRYCGKPNTPVRQVPLPIPASECYCEDCVGACREDYESVMPRHRVVLTTGPPGPGGPVAPVAGESVPTLDDHDGHIDFFPDGQSVALDGHFSFEEMRLVLAEMERLNGGNFQKGAGRD